ncbi:hypothetical protein GWI34_21480 [Actinomadura sp. DSM 109109]|nr:hypothetical protein [Actinomadura lepetitiana]
MRTVRVIAGFVALVVFVYVFGDGSFICTAIGGGLALTAYRFNRRLWIEARRKIEFPTRPLIWTVVFTTAVVTAIKAGEGDGGLSDAVTGFGATGLLLAGWLLIKCCESKALRGSK